MLGDSVSVSGEPPKVMVDAAARVFGDRLPLATRYATLLGNEGVRRGLIGPREAPRLWERHLLNCAVLAELIPADVAVVDVGSGAGLPGLVLAIARPDLRVTLVDSQNRRTVFLMEAVDLLGLDGTEVVRARAEECVGRLRPADVVTARAVAPLDRLAGWCLPLLRPGGVLLALKGSSAADEVLASRTAVRHYGGEEPVMRQCGLGIVDPPATVIEVRVAGHRRSTRQEGHRSAAPGSGPRRSEQIPPAPGQPARYREERSRQGRPGQARSR